MYLAAHNSQLNEVSSLNEIHSNAEPAIQTAAPSAPRLSVKEKALQRKKAIEKRYPTIVVPVVEVEELEEIEEQDKKK